MKCKFFELFFFSFYPKLWISTLIGSVGCGGGGGVKNRDLLQKIGFLFFLYLLLIQFSLHTKNKHLRGRGVKPQKFEISEILKNSTWIPNLWIPWSAFCSGFFCLLI